MSIRLKNKILKYAIKKISGLNKTYYVYVLTYTCTCVILIKRQTCVYLEITGVDHIFAFIFETNTVSVWTFNNGLPDDND